MDIILQKNCVSCGYLFQKPSNESLKNWNNHHKYCSRKCANKAPRSQETRLKMRLASIGKIAWNKGRQLSDEHKAHMRKKHKPFSIETRQKMSLYHRGRSMNLSEESRRKKSLSQKGEKGSNWQGGITPINDRIRRSVEFKIWRKKVFVRDNYTCQKYKIRGGNLHPHHILNFSQYPNLRFDISNGITLSDKAHREFHKKYGKVNNTREQLDEFLSSI